MAEGTVKATAISKDPLTGLNSNQNDTVANVENITGSAYADKFTGNSVNNIINGGGGDDEFILSGGVDTYDGGSGSDTVNDSNSSNKIQVTLNLDQQVTVSFVTPGGSTVGTNILSNVENVYGADTTTSGDIITGDSNANKLYGLRGDDFINGMDGDDLIVGGFGKDFLTGGLGNDTVSFEDISTHGFDITLNDNGDATAVAYALSGLQIQRKMILYSVLKTLLARMEQVMLMMLFTVTNSKIIFTV